jgi:hypothetical protein
MDKNFKDLDEFESKVIGKVNIDQDGLEEIKGALDEDEKIEEENVPYLHNEDVATQGLNICMSKLIQNAIPRKTEAEIIDKLKGDLMQEDGDDVKFVCQNHDSAKAYSLCVNKSCDFVFYCRGCRKNHQQSCNRTGMDLHLADLKNENFVDDGFDLSDFKHDVNIDKVKDLIAEYKDKMNNAYDLLEKNMISKIRMFSKEFMLKKIKGNIEDKLDEFKGKSKNIFINLKR